VFFEIENPGVRRWEPMNSILKASTISIALTISVLPHLVFAQSINLTGTWLGTGYTCRGNEPPEKVRIVHKGDTVTATKVTGDDCITAGEITWRGTFKQGSFTVQHHVSDGPRPKRKWFIGGTVRVESADLLAVGSAAAPLTFRRIASDPVLPPGLAAAILAAVLAETLRTRRKSRATGWVEIELLDEAGEPVAGEAYRITLPDGSVREGVLDASGRARVEGFEPGPSQVTFPHIDAGLWRRAEEQVEA